MSKTPPFGLPPQALARICTELAQTAHLGKRSE